MLFPAHLIRLLAVEADRDPRSVVAVIEGRASPLTVSSVVKAAGRLGIELPTRQEAPKAT